MRVYASFQRCLPDRVFSHERCVSAIDASAYDITIPQHSQVKPDIAYV